MRLRLGAILLATALEAKGTGSPHPYGCNRGTFTPYKFTRGPIVTPLKLTLEGATDVHNASEEDVERGIAALLSADGPTFMLLSDPKGRFVRALGSAGRYTAEGREMFVDGFLRWRAGSHDSYDDSQTPVLFFRTCPQGIHAPRQCPYIIRSREVLRPDDVAAILLKFHSARRLHLGYAWRIMYGGSHPQPNPARATCDLSLPE